MNRRKFLAVVAMSILAVNTHMLAFAHYGLNATTVIAALLGLPLWIFVFWLIITDSERRW